MEKVTNIKPNKECCSATNVLWYLVFTGFAVNYMIRINLNIAIVSMVKTRPKSNLSLTSDCILTPSDNPLLLDNNISSSLSPVENLWISPPPNSTAVPSSASRTFLWNEQQQSHILGAFFWVHWVTQIPGGILGSRYGTKLVFGLSNFAGVLCCFLIPFSAYAGHNWLLFLRMIQGLICGFAWPSMHNMTARWIPPNERSKFVTAYLGSSVGAALTYPVCGLIIDRWGWELAFYVCGVFGCLWYIGWWFLVYDSPAEHPRISDSEKAYIIHSLGQSYSKEKAPVPWRDILTSLPVWMNILAQWGGIWGLFTLMTHTPTYFKFIHGWNIRATGLLSGMPHVLRMLWAYIFSQLGDFLLRTNRMTRTNVRKLATSVCTIGQGLFMLALAYSGCNYTLAVVFLSASIAMNGSVSTGPLASVVDISPNYASVVLGLVNTVVSIVGFITPAVVGYLTHDNQTVQQWQKVFWIATFMLITSGIIYISLATSELQPWNSPKQRDNGLLPESELMVIKIKDAGDKNNGSNKVCDEEKPRIIIEKH